MAALVLLMPFGAYKIGGEVANISTENLGLLASITLALVYVRLGGCFRRHNVLLLWAAVFLRVSGLSAALDAIKPSGHVWFMVPFLGSIVIFSMFGILGRVRVGVGW